jgi:hypothetical protein
MQDEKTSVCDISIITEQRVFKPIKNPKPQHDDQIISFRSKKESFNMTNVEIEQKENYILDNTLIMQEICNKITKVKRKSSHKGIDENTNIKKVFASHRDDIIERELLFSPKIEEEDAIEESEDEENEENIFWNLKNNLDESTDSKKRSSSANTKSHCNKKTNIGKIVATFSRIEQGRAIFVTNDDFIFVLPSLALPKSLVIGNCYMFDISEQSKYQIRLSNIYETIQKKYIKQVDQ